MEITTPNTNLKVGEITNMWLCGVGIIRFEVLKVEGERTTIKPLNIVSKQNASNSRQSRPSNRPKCF